MFAVELAVTDEERAKGLMYRRSVPESYGMLFDFKRDQEVTMWMRNTYVSLDMIFIQSDGRIRRIAENTETGVRQDHLVGRAGASAVLEVVAEGTCQEVLSSIVAGGSGGVPDAAPLNRATGRPGRLFARLLPSRKKSGRGRPRSGCRPLPPRAGTNVYRSRNPSLAGYKRSLVAREFWVLPGRMSSNPAAPTN